MTVVSDSPIFIVGASRSGTSLMQAILNGHPDIQTSGETHYFDHLRIEMKGREQQALSANDLQRCEDYFLALSHRPYGHSGDPEKGRIQREELRQAAHSVGEGADAYFEGYCRLKAFKARKARWGEKTPRHVFRITEILERYPKAKVICMVRDPRAIIASYREIASTQAIRVHNSGFDFERDPEHLPAIKRDRRRVNKSYNILIHCLLWRGVIRAAWRAQQRFDKSRVYLQRYEDIVESPKKSVTDLLNWLSLDFSPTMLDVPIFNSSFSAFNRHGGISQNSVQRWRKKLSATEIGEIQTVCGKLMKQSGYDIDPVRTPFAALGFHCLGLPLTVTRAALANRDRIANVPGYIWNRLRFSVGSWPPLTRSK